MFSYFEFCSFENVKMLVRIEIKIYYLLFNKIIYDVSEYVC